MPDYIKAALVDDWENVTKNSQLVPLPHEFPVNTVLSEWFEHEKDKRPAGSPEADLLEEVVAGLRQYFDVSLGRILLYKFVKRERQKNTRLIATDSNDCNTLKSASQ